MANSSEMQKSGQFDEIEVANRLKWIKLISSLVMYATPLLLIAPMKMSPTANFAVAAVTNGISILEDANIMIASVVVLYGFKKRTFVQL